MGIFNKNKNNNNNNSFDEIQKMSNGDLFEKTQKLINQYQIDLANINTNFNESKNIEKKFLEKSFQPYWLLELQTNYFVNTIDFKTKNNYLFQQIKLLLRATFKNGIGGILKRNNKYIIGTIANIEYNIFNEIIKCEITPLNRSTIFFKENELDNLGKIVLNKEEIDKNLIILKWGSAGLSAWITIYKMCLIQSDLLAMINVDSYSYIKKFVYKINDPNSPTNEIDDYFNVWKPYIKIMKGVDLKNRIELNSDFNVNSNPNILIEYYKQTMGIYYSMFGRRTNNDYKKERSVTQEIGLTSDNYIILEKDWKDEFKIFIDEIKNKFNEDIEYIEQKYNIEGDLNDETKDVEEEEKINEN